jgi:hypothetical protein
VLMMLKMVIKMTARGILTRKVTKVTGYDEEGAIQ